MVQGVTIADGCILDVNPATDELIDRVRMASMEDLDAVIARAKAAQPAWEAIELEERGALLKEACKKLGDDKVYLVGLIVQEMGKVIFEAEEEVNGAIYKGDFIDLVVDANRPVCLDDGECMVFRQPHGVVAICSPWNYPCDEILMLAIPALVAGNTIVVKPSEVTPLVGAKVVDVLASVLPPNVANLVQGDGSVGAPLVKHPDVDMVAMTGSSATGKQIMEACARSLKPLVLELGGKDPMVIFGDADLEKAAEDAVTYSLFNCGQVCCAIERIFVEECVKADFEKKIVEMASSWTVGNGLDKSVKVGPMVSSTQKNVVKTHVDDAVSCGASLLYQSDVPCGSPNFYPVTVLSDLKQDMLIQREETFGPVIGIASFSGSEEEAVRLSNDTQYGLSACVYSDDLEKARRVSRRIRAGQVGINNYPMMNASSSCPWVGHKGSGFGYHSGPDGWRQFSVPQSIVGAS